MKSMQDLLATVRRREASVNVPLGARRVFQLLVMLAAVAFVLHLAALQHSSPSSHLSHGEHAGSTADVQTESSTETSAAADSTFGKSDLGSSMATAIDVDHDHEFECDEPSALRVDTTTLGLGPALPCLQVIPRIELTYPIQVLSDQVRHAPNLVCELCIQRI